jgi:hypothetical protein
VFIGRCLEVAKAAKHHVAPRAAARWRHMRSEAALKVRELTNSGEFGCFTNSIVIKRRVIFHIGAYLWFMRSISV